MGTPSGSGASSRTRTNGSSMTRPALTSRIDALLERFDADAPDGVEEDFIRPRAQLKISRNDILHDIRHFCIRNGGSEQCTELGILVGTAADRDLEILLAVLLHAEQPDMAHVMVSARIDASRNIDVEPPKILREVEIAKSPRQLLRDRNRTRVRQAAIIETRAGDDVGHQAHVGRRDT